MVIPENDYINEGDINEGDLIDFMLTCKVEKDYYSAEAEWDEWWQYYFDADTDMDSEIREEQ